jgi:hypothetical protein
MIAEKLSKTVVERIKAADQDVVVWDNTLPGFGVRVKPSGVRSYIIPISQPEHERVEAPDHRAARSAVDLGSGEETSTRDARGCHARRGSG